jgi:hypothetical protein
MNTNNLIRLIRTARGLEAGGFYNAAKLMWAMAYSQEIKLSNESGIPRGQELYKELGAILADWRVAGVDPTIITALEKGQAAVRAESTISYNDIPDVYVSRTSGEVFIGQSPDVTTSGDYPLGLKRLVPVWYLEPLSPAEALAGLESAPAQIEAQVAGLTNEQMEMSPAPGEWSIRELLEHLSMAQDLFAGRVEKLLTEDKPDLKSMAVWSMKAQGRTPQDVLASLRDSRAQSVERLKAISPADWMRTGWHDEWSWVTLLDQATYFARHEMSHMPQFKQIRDTLIT